MKRDEAKRLVKQTFEQPFLRERFELFARNLLPTIEPPSSGVIAGAQLPKGFEDHISSITRLGKYEDVDGEILDVVAIKLKNSASLDRARTRQRNLMAHYLATRNKDAALVAFYADASTDWRFSFVKLAYETEISNSGRVRAKREFTPARRFSFLVGETEPSHTAQQQLVPLLEKEEQLRVSEIEAAFNIETVTSEFFKDYKELYLSIKDELDIQVKKNLWIEQEFNRCNIDTVNFAKKLLGQIVFLYFVQKKGWLGVPKDGKWGEGDKDFLSNLYRHRGKKNYFKEILEPFFYEALALERPGDYYKDLDCKVPFLNGGLFEPLNGFLWKKTPLAIDDRIFSKIFDVFNLYNFTVREDEPLEKQVAVDPEMLGKVFENLLEIRDRRSRGTYYTPRDIVHYMCQQSLISYLNKATGLSLDDIEQLIVDGDVALENDFAKENGRKSGDYGLSGEIRYEAEKLDYALSQIKICDPAIGSGAFPVGMMTEIVRARNVLTTYMHSTDKRSLYDFKWHCIENSLYGVDIDLGAVEIAKLRLWLSLIVDEENYEEIRPLPNLDYRIITGDSLSSVVRNLFNFSLYPELERKKLQYFSSTSRKNKDALRQEIASLIDQLTSGQTNFDFEIHFSEVFASQKGFDLVIANPPYISHDRIANKPQLRDFSVYQPFADIYCYFIERAIRICCPGGVICLITSNSFIKAEYASLTRKFILANANINHLINIEDFQVFEHAIVNVAISIIYKKQGDGLDTDARVLSKSFASQEGTFRQFVETNDFVMAQVDFQNPQWILKPSNDLALLKKITSSGKSLEQWGAKIRLGLATGANYALVISKEVKSNLEKADKRNQEIIKPVLRGREIQRYHYAFADNYLLLLRNGIDVQKDYPAIYSYLDSFGEAFKSRGARGIHWTNLRATAFLDDFKREKIVWIELTDKGRFALSSEEVYLLNSAYFMLPPAELNAKYVLGILNSKIIQYFMNLTAATSGMGTKRWINAHVKEFPIPEPRGKAALKIVSLVDEAIKALQVDMHANILEIEKEIDNAVYFLFGLSESEINQVETNVAETL